MKENADIMEGGEKMDGNAGGWRDEIVKEFDEIGRTRSVRLYLGSWWESSVTYTKIC